MRAISIHAPTRGATGFEINARREAEHFNPRSHERSDLFHAAFLHLSLISIHAPTRGATYINCNLVSSDRISIHAPTRGATVPRAYAAESLIISIHAPTRGATLPPVLHCPFRRKFQSTLPREERRKQIECFTWRLYFNPRSHERSD